jgi:hypothetical protein
LAPQSTFVPWSVCRRVPFFFTAVDAEGCRRRACGRAVGPVGGRPAFLDLPVAAAPDAAVRCAVFRRALVFFFLVAMGFSSQGAQ